MNFYKLIKQQYDIYKERSLTSCKSCPCKTLRDKVFGPSNRPTSCLKEMMRLLEKCNMDNTSFAFFCNELRSYSVEIAKKLFEKEFNKI